jgi:hypothetical protein
MDIDEPMNTQATGDLVTSSQTQEEKEVLVFPDSLLGPNKALKVNDLTNLLKVPFEDTSKNTSNTRFLINTFRYNIETSRAIERNGSKY